MLGHQASFLLTLTYNVNNLGDLFPFLLKNTQH